MTRSTSQPFFAWVYDTSARPIGAPLRASLEKHMLIAVQKIESIIGSPHFDGFVFSDNMTAARGFIERHAGGVTDLRVGDQGLHIADRETWSSNNRRPRA